MARIWLGREPSILHFAVIDVSIEGMYLKKEAGRLSVLVSLVFTTTPYRLIFRLHAIICVAYRA